MSLRINEGYIITDSIHIGEYEFVLGVNQHSAQNFVTWRCDGGNYYYWGHYFSDLFSAQKDLVERAAEKVREQQEIWDEKKAREPKLSPWGKVQTCTELCSGIYSVSTAGHGGIMARMKASERIFSEAARKYGFVEGDYLCFEEDCDEQVALRELMDKNLFKAPINSRLSPEAYETAINASIQAHHPEYWEYRQKNLPKTQENDGTVKKKERDKGDAR